MIQLHVCHINNSSGERKEVEMSLPSDTNCVAIATTFLNRAHQCHMTSMWHGITNTALHNMQGHLVHKPNHKIKGRESDPIIDNEK